MARMKYMSEHGGGHAFGIGEHQLAMKLRLS